MQRTELDDLVRALSNQTRRQILSICSEDFVSAGTAAADIELALASVSEHLKVLRKHGLVDLERQGNSWLYRTNHRRLADVLARLTAELPLKEKPDA